MSYDVANLAEKIAKFSENWSPRVAVALNDYQVKVAKFDGEFVWHDHEDTDELFVVLRRAANRASRSVTVHLQPGELFMVPRGVEHMPVAEGVCEILLVESRGVVNTGDTGGELEAENDAWA